MALADYREHTSYHLDIMTLVNNEGEAFDMRGLFLQCFINESIYDNFLSGEVVFVDSLGLFEKIKFSGQESLRIRFYQPTGTGQATHEDDIIDKVFRIYKIGDNKRIDQNTQTVSCRFASPELLDAKRKRISQSFKGEVLSLAAKIAEDYLDISNDPSSISGTLQPGFEWRTPASEEHQVIIPNWTVQNTINWLCSKAQANDYSSSPLDSYFFYQTANGNFRINSIREMFTSESATDTFYYTDVGNEYNQAPLGYDNTNPEDPSSIGPGSGRRILDYYVASTSSVLDAAVSGFFGSKLITINNTGKYYSERTYDYLERFFSKSKGERGLDDQPLIRLEPETLYIGSRQGQVTADTTTEGTYNTYKALNKYPDAYHLLMNQSEFVNDDKGIVSSVNGSAHFGGQQMRQATAQLMKFHTTQCLISTRTDISCGQVINLKIPLPLPDATGLEREQQFHDGRHLITNIQWIFNQHICNTNIVCMKDSLQNNLETTAAKYVSGLPDEDGA
tara:strand:- start:19 stop:1533 length:1515 start_codon:yes stop_codon:yes gene_type:complete